MCVRVFVCVFIPSHSPLPLHSFSFFLSSPFQLSALTISSSNSIRKQQKTNEPPSLLSPLPLSFSANSLFLLPFAKEKCHLLSKTLSCSFVLSFFSFCLCLRVAMPSFCSFTQQQKEAVSYTHFCFFLFGRPALPTFCAEKGKKRRTTTAKKEFTLGGTK